VLRRSLAIGIIGLSATSAIEEETLRLRAVAAIKNANVLIAITALHFRGAADAG
jgi:hypothetical protein